MSLPCSVRDLIPQKGKMGFDQILVKTQPEDCESTALIGPDNIFINDDRQLSDIALIEYLNQLIAAVHGYNGKKDCGPGRKGLFVGVQEANFIRTVRSGDRLTLKGITIAEISQVTFVQGIIEREGDRIAELVTKLYLVKDSAEFDALTNKGRILPPGPGIEINDSQPPSYLGSNLLRKLSAYLYAPNIGADIISFKIACPGEFDAFDGHFPGNPILPGIILLEIAKLGLALLLKKPVRLKYLKKMKIGGVVFPDQVISCTVKTDRNSCPEVSFSAGFEAGDQREISRFTGICDEGK